jgi:hypothetical protein
MFFSYPVSYVLSLSSRLYQFKYVASLMIYINKAGCNFKNRYKDNPAAVVDVDEKVRQEVTAAG